MNHFLLPRRKTGPYADTDMLLAGDCAMEVLVNSMLKKGCRKSRLFAKAFGGGTIVASIRMTIAESNVEFANEWLQREGYPLDASDFGGPRARKVLCVPSPGDAYCRRTAISQTDAEELAKAEQAHERLLAAPKLDRVELF